MPLVSDTCVKCKRPVKSSVVCNTCQQHFHPGCARDFVKSRPLTDCCRKQLSYLLENLDAKTRRASLKSTSSNTSSVSSFKSASSSPLDHTFKARGSTPSLRLSTARVSSSLKSPVTPSTPVSPGQDAVFNSPIASPTMSHLPVDWAKKSLDDKITLLMEKFCNSEVATNEKLNDLSVKLLEVTESQKQAAANLTELATNVGKNAESIAAISSDLLNLKEVRKSDLEEISKRLSNIEKSAPVSFVPQQVLGSTSELVISGIPDTVANSLTPSDVSAAVLKSLELPNLIGSVLSARKFVSKKKKLRNQNTPNTHSYIVSMMSTPARDFIIDKKRKLRNLPAKKVFPVQVDVASEGLIYVNEFLLPETHQLLLKTKEKAKNRKFKFVWVKCGQIFARKDENSERLVINHESDLTKLD